MIFILSVMVNSNTEVEKKDTSNFLFFIEYFGISSFSSYTDDVILLNVGGELMDTTRDTLTDIPNTVLASITLSTSENRLKLAQYDENRRIFLDLSPTLFKHLLEQLRQ